MDDKKIIIGFMGVLLAIMTAALVSAGLDFEGTTIAKYEQGMVNCTVINNGDGTTHFGCDMPTGTAVGLNDAFAWGYGYEAEIPDPENIGEVMPNPESKAEFSLRKGIYSYLSEIFFAHKVFIWEQSKPNNDFVE